VGIDPRTPRFDARALVVILIVVLLLIIIIWFIFSRGVGKRSAPAQPLGFAAAFGLSRHP
jgi:predicted permease